MALATDLMGVGLQQEQAVRLGYSDATAVTAAGTTTGTATPLNGSVTNVALTTAASQTGLRLPANAELMSVYIVRNVAATAANIYPHTGGSINASAQDAAVTLAQNLARIFIRVAADRWVSFLSA